MKQVTAKFNAAMRSSSQTIKAKVDLLYGRTVVDGGSNLNLVSGSISYDMSGRVLATCSLVLAEQARLPTAANVGQLTPYGYEVAVSAGPVYADGTSEFQPLFLGPIQRATFDGRALTTTLECADRAQQVVDARVEEDYVITAGTNIAAAIQSLVDSGVPNQTYAFCSTVHVSPQMVIAAGSDRWEQAQDMARSIGCQLFFDGFGRCVLREEQVLTGQQPVWEFRQGVDGTLITADLSLDREQVYNRTIATGSSPDSTTIPRGVATDLDPQSPTYYSNNGFGKKPRFYSSPFILTDEQAAQAAAAIQAADSGMARGVEFTAATHWGLEPGDMVRIVHSRLNLSEDHLLEAFDLDLPRGQLAA